MAFIKILVALLLPTVWATTSGMIQPHLIFSHIGDIAREAGYGHLLVPIPTDSIQKVADHLEDIMNVRTEFAGNLNNSYGDIEKYGILRIKEKIDMILSLASKEGFVAKEMQTDHVNKLREAMVRLDRRRRASPSILTAVVAGLAAFGGGLWSASNWGSLQKAVDEGRQLQDDLIAELDERFLRINEITQFMEKKYSSVVKHVGSLEGLTREAMAKNIDHYVHLMMLHFRFGLQDFMMGITELMHHRLSPLLVAPEDLLEVFNALLEEARNKGLETLSIDAGILFQAPTSTIMTEAGRLYAVVHLPLYGGGKLALYKYVPAPFFLYRTRMMMTVESPADYLALDSHHTVGKHMTAWEFHRCRKTSTLYHCPQMNLLSKRPQSLCLYNLFVQDPLAVEETCEVSVNKLKTHATQIDANQYRLMTTEPTQLIAECTTGNNVTLVEGVTLVELTEECPKASTSEYLFVRTPDIHQHRDLIDLSVLAKSRKWLGDVTREMDEAAVQEAIEQAMGDSTSMALPALRAAIQDRHLKTYKDGFHYVLIGIVVIVLGSLVWKGFLFMSHRCRERGYLLWGRRAVQRSGRANRDEDPNDNPCFYLPFLDRRRIG